ncbi:hypothetical protein B0T10DRAFT_555574 [Thelonectria olida]|uniref:Histone chaperone domain-containing protein n=1 Tax=Thelonectria olida TaxID=1576542 RepID=A0A9P8WFV4_9HYPO|nr:hypothetical protein B0T10DRAFT_555574 [Thelonectria olida]
MPSRNTDEAPSGEVMDDSYVSRSGSKNEAIPVQSDSDRVIDPIDTSKADTDAQLEKDDAEAIDTRNIMKERTRHAQPEGSYREPGDTEGLPDDTGRSANTLTRNQNTA